MKGGGLNSADELNLECRGTQITLENEVEVNSFLRF